MGEFQGQSPDLARLRAKVCRLVEALPGGWCQIARITGHDRSHLWRAFKQEDYTPSLLTVLSVLPVLGLRLELIDA